MIGEGLKVPLADLLEQPVPLKGRKVGRKTKEGRKEGRRRKEEKKEGRKEGRNVQVQALAFEGKKMKEGR